MIAYTTLGVNNMDAAIVFYDAVFGALGAARTTTSPTWTGYARSGERDPVFLTQPWDKAEATGGNGVMLAFLAADRDVVDRFFAAAMAHGGTDAGAPGVREGMNPVFYAAYVRDADGNKLCAFVRK